ncbi:hypothetical protein JD844_017603 [Phrynosoma platyrhinos]|uniref:Glomulin n=1 Tax=Phrynosoma platyrhinos TaxID=52577 RepID=A0ABQ7SM52_PHRPL|nr:hypothetical protein JD844_017603 [Phrynosoma platyrhinos]
MAKEELQAIIQRCQILDEEEFKGEDFNLFQVAGQKCLEEGYISEVLEVVQNEKNRLCSPKELVLGFLEQIEQASQEQVSQLILILLDPLHIARGLPGQRQPSDKLASPTSSRQLVKVKTALVSEGKLVDSPMRWSPSPRATSPQLSTRTIFPCLGRRNTNQGRYRRSFKRKDNQVLLKLGSKKAYSVGLSLSTILNELSHLPIPYTKKQLEEDEHGLCQCCSALPCFVRPFVDEVVLHMEASLDGDCKELKKELLAFCLKSIKYPLLMAELGHVPEEKAENPFRQFAADILVILQDIRQLFPNVFSQYRCRSDSWDDDLSEVENEQHADSLACLSYMVFVQNSFGINCFPLVFSPSYILQCNMVHIQVLLNRKEESVLSKGLALLENCLVRLEDDSLPTECLDFKVFVTTSEDLVKVSTMCPFESLRKKSIKVLQLCIDKFEEEGKYILFRCLLQTSNHSGVEGYIIQNIKNQIDLALRVRNVNGVSKGKTVFLSVLIGIMTALNLLRYLFIKDKEAENRTCVWTELYKIQQNFLKPLHTGLGLSRAHYKAEIKHRKENKGESSTSTKSTCITVGGKKMPKLTSQMELQVLQSALVTFDLIESILARVEELTDTLSC